MVEYVTVKTPQMVVLRDAATICENKFFPSVDREIVRVVGGRGGMVRNVTGIAKGITYDKDHATGFKLCYNYNKTTYPEDWTVEGCVAIGFATHPAPPDRYQQGDGFGVELEALRIKFRSNTAIKCLDGGFDLKSLDMFLENCIGIENKKTFRLWNSMRLNNCKSINPTECHFHIRADVAAGQKPKLIEIDGLYATGDKPLFYVETPAGRVPPQIVVKNHSLVGITQKTKFEGPAPTVTFL